MAVVWQKIFIINCILGRVRYYIINYYNKNAFAVFTAFEKTMIFNVYIHAIVNCSFYFISVNKIVTIRHQTS